MTKRNQAKILRDAANATNWNTCQEAQIVRSFLRGTANEIEHGGQLNIVPADFLAPIKVLG